LLVAVHKPARTTAGHDVYRCADGQHRIRVPRHSELTARAVATISKSPHLNGRTSVSYQITARRWARGWELDIDGATVTQSHGLRDAERMVRDWLDITGHADAATVELFWTYDVGDNALQAELADVRHAIKEAARLQVLAEARSRKVVSELLGRGIKSAEIATMTGLSKQRVSQLIKSAAGTSTAPNTPADPSR
jgi:hypothetical protein